jgi:hypothetical protein
MTIYAHASLDEKRKALRKLRDALGCQRCCQTPRSERSAEAFWLLRGGGQGQDRTADLPLFRRTLVPTELPDRVRRDDAASFKTVTGLSGPDGI